MLPLLTISRLIRFKKWILVVSMAAAFLGCQESPQPSQVSISNIDVARTGRAEIADPDGSDEEKITIGATVTIVEAQSELPFKARVDTGASFCSMHVEEIDIEGEADDMNANVEKSVRIKLKNEQDEEEWIETEITDCYVVKNAEKAERRYRVPMELVWKGIKREVLVTLNDRSRMTYPVLIGRNFLQGDFLVDVDKVE